MIGEIRCIKGKRPQGVKNIERQLEEARADLKSIAKYGINGIGGQESRLMIAERILKLKQLLLDSGTYQRTYEDEEDEI